MLIVLCFILTSRFVTQMKIGFVEGAVSYIDKHLEKKFVLQLIQNRIELISI